MSVNIITEPKVYLIGRQTIDEAALNAFLAANDVESWETDTDVAAEKIVETAGRVCYMSFAKPRPGGNAAYIGHILEVGHGSVLEHAVFSLLIEGVSRSLTHELIRHRAGFGYSQLSQRFVDESEAEFVVPPLYREAVEAAQIWRTLNGVRSLQDYQELVKSSIERWGSANRFNELARFGDDWLSSIEAARAAYHRHSERAMEVFPELRSIVDSTSRRKKAREAARSVLPNATETKIFVTGNARALRHFIETRGTREADAEIQRLAVAVAKILIDAADALFADITIGREVEPSREHEGEFVNVVHSKV